MAEVVPVQVTSPSLEDVGKDLGNWLGTMRSFHVALAGGPLTGNPTPVEGSLRSELVIPEFAEVAVAPAHAKEYQRIEVLGGFAYGIAADSEEEQFFTQSHWFEGGRIFRARSITDDQGLPTGMRIEGINPNPLENAASGPNAAEGIVIPGNELLLAHFSVRERDNSY